MLKKLLIPILLIFYAFQVESNNERIINKLGDETRFFISSIIERDNPKRVNQTFICKINDTTIVDINIARTDEKVLVMLELNNIGRDIIVGSYVPMDEIIKLLDEPSDLDSEE